MLFKKHYVMLIYAMKLLMKLLMWGKGAFNILI